MAEPQFIDISGHQGSIDPVAIRKAGIVGVFWKATEGLTFVDPSFGKTSDSTAVRIEHLHERHVALENAGLVSVPYHFCRADNRPTTAGAREEARWFSSVLDKAGYPHGKPVCLDYEVKPVARDWAEAFADELQKLRGRGMITYVGRFFWNQQKAPKGGAMLWLPAYVPRPVYAVYAAYMRARGFVVKAWQYTSSGRVPGVRGPVDRNVWFGSEAEFRAWAKAPTPKPPPPAPQPKGDKTVREAQQQLRKIGWPVTVDGVKGPQTTQAIRDFQRGWAGPMKMAQHGKLGIHTRRALKWSSEHGGLTSKGGHFKYGEFKSPGNGWIKVARALVRGLEKYRRVAGPTAVWGYRDPVHNAKTPGAAKDSQHIYGNAADLKKPKLSVAKVRSLGVFSGIGYQDDTGLVRHVDVRHVGPNTTNGTTKNPTVWRY